LGKKVLAAFVPAVLAAFLIFAGGCGAYNPNGNGSGGGSASSPGAAQGFYSCTLQSGQAMQALILSDDTFWGMFGTLATSSFTATGMATGKGASGTTTYTGAFTQFLSTGVSFTTAITATDVPGLSMSGTVTLNGAQTGFGGSALPSSAYTYSTPASIASIAGTWSGTLLDGSAVTLVISTSGNVTTTSTGCQVSGTVTANATNNFFTTNLRFGGNPCVASLANQNATGVALVYLLQDGTTTQLLMPATVGTTVGTLFTAEQ
jgi:hypothetical protein